MPLLAAIIAVLVLTGNGWFLLPLFLVVLILGTISVVRYEVLGHRPKEKS